MVFILLEYQIGTKRHTHVIEPLYEISDEKAADIDAAVARIVAGEPFQYVLGTTCFYGRDFHVTPSVLIPRPETEVLCRTALELLAGCAESFGREAKPMILDMCTGSGCIAWTMALESPGADVFAVDISQDALAVASAQDFSGEMMRSGARAPQFLRADVLDEIPSGPAGDFISGSFDMILSNPPYVMDKEKSLMRDNVLNHEPHLALFVSDYDPLIFYRAVARWSSHLLSPAGVGLVEINEALGAETAQVFLDAGFTVAEVLKDFSSRDRFVLFRRR